METTKQLLPILKQLNKILKKEHKALVSNDNIQVEKLVKEKEEIVERLSSISSKPTVAESKLLQEIKQLQDDNLLLTKQAIAFNNNFLQIVGETVQKTNATYSKKGGLAIQDDIGFINQSI